MGDVPLACNECWNKLQSKAFKTSCDHCFCEQCADSVFADRRRRCSVCQADVSSLLEFQIVGSPILDEQLTDVRSTLQAIACANGASSLDSWISGLHRFERIQLAMWGSRQGQSAQDALREAEERERVLGERELQSRQLVASLEHECEQVRKERDQAQRGVQDLQTALEERSRQADNWRAMYEALKNGGRVPIPPTTVSGMPTNANARMSGAAALMGPGGPHKLLRASEPTPGYAPSNPGFGTMDNNAQRAYGNPMPGPDIGAGRARTNSLMGGAESNNPVGGGFDNFRSSFPRSNSMPIRPATRDSLASLLNRSVAPRTSAPAGGFRPPNAGPSSLPQLHDPVRSTFFAPASLRAMSPASNSTSGLHRSSHVGGGPGSLAQGGMMY